jgi:hypothetical protein
VTGVEKRAMKIPIEIQKQAVDLAKRYLISNRVVAKGVQLRLLR